MTRIGGNLSSQLWSRLSASANSWRHCFSRYWYLYHCWKKLFRFWARVLTRMKRDKSPETLGIIEDGLLLTMIFRSCLSSPFTFFPAPPSENGEKRTNRTSTHEVYLTIKFRRRSGCLFISKQDKIANGSNGVWEQHEFWLGHRSASGTSHRCSLPSVFPKKIYCSSFGRPSLSPSICVVLCLVFQEVSAILTLKWRAHRAERCPSLVTAHSNIRF